MCSLCCLSKAPNLSVINEVHAEQHFFPYMSRALALAACMLSSAEAFSVVPRAPAASTATSSAFALARPRQAASAPAATARSRLEELEMVVKPLKIGIVGVTGAVGKEIIDVLGNRKFPVSELRLFASARSAGQSMKTPFGDKKVEEFSLAASRECDVVFLAVSGDFALEWVPQITANNGPLVIDNSSAFRYDKDVPLIVPEINIDAAKKSKSRLIANPNCTTAIALMALKPLHDAFGIKRAIISTYQAASGAGAEGMAELQEGSAAMANGKEAVNKVFAHRLPFNLIPHIDKFLEDGYTKEERKVTWETRKIMDLPDLPVSCTSVRIPTLRAHAESITIETERKIDMALAYKVLGNFPGLKLTDDVKNNVYPMPLTASTKYDVEVGRVRKNDVFGEYGLDLFVCGDQLLRGAALNAVIIAEEMFP